MFDFGVFVGSRPPDSLWDRIRNQGFDVTVYDHIANKEKKVDMELGASMLDIIHFMDPGVIILVAGDGDYYPILTRALKYNWKIEVWFWSSGMKYSFACYVNTLNKRLIYIGISGDL